MVQAYRLAPMRVPFPQVTLFREQIEIDAPASEVFARLADVNTWTQWARGVLVAELLDTPMQRGARFMFKPRIGGLTLRTRALEYDDGRVLAWGREILGAGVEHRFEVTALGPNRTRVLQHEYAWGTMALLLWPLASVIGSFDRALAEDLKRSFD
jgi:hypothetical protein